MAGGGPIKEGLLLPPELDIICCRNITDFLFKKVRALKYTGPDRITT